MKLPEHYHKLIKKHDSPLEEFLKGNPGLLDALKPAGREAFHKICGSITHWRSRKANEYFIQIFKNLQDAEKSPFHNLIVNGALRISKIHWSLTRPYFDAARALPEHGDFIEDWIELVSLIGVQDIDVATAFLEQTPRALDTIGRDHFFTWGEQALDALTLGRKVWKAAKAYLIESVQNQCTTPLTRWQFFLNQAGRIAEVSPTAAKVFIEHGNRVCLLLSDEETIEWIDDGLAGFAPEKKQKGWGARQLRSHGRPEGAKTEQDLINYFSGTSQKALEKRDGFAKGVLLKARSNTLALICEAYLGQQVRIRSNTSLTMVPGFSGGAATDGRTIYLPDKVPQFSLYKLMALHQSMLMRFDIWQKDCGHKEFDPFALHLEADRQLLERLPGLFNEMKSLTEGALPAVYPLELDRELFSQLPWWGDILPGLVRDTNATISKLKEKAEDRTDLPPEVIESLVTNMMADGERDVNGLWSRLMDIFDTVILSPDAEELEENVRTFFYREWDDDLSDFKMDWCLVRQRQIKDDPNPFVSEVRDRLHGIIGLIRRQFTRLKPERFKKYRAQPFGDALDIDALVEAWVDRKCGSFLSENIYVRRDKRLRDVAVLFLLDMSGSTEEKVHGRRVIDIQKEAMVLMAEALESLGDKYGLYGFTSEGRFRVDFFNIKDFNEPWSEQAFHRLGNVEPKELTRMGAVLRHAIYKFDSVQATIKLMVIMTDGRPYDYEYGGLNYAIADTKNAVQEARRHNIHPFIITSDQKGASYLKRISPETQSIILRKVELLPVMLPAIYKRLTV